MRERQAFAGGARTLINGVFMPANDVCESEWFEYPASWEEAYRARRGSGRYFAQYALMELLRQRHGVQSLTWLHLASVDSQTKRRFAAGEPWVPASPSPSRTDPRRTRKRAAAWKTMREQMNGTFERLQQEILRAGFIGAYQGEPDLFCWSPKGWFFAEAKRPNESFLPSQIKWCHVARSVPGIDCQIFGCRVVLEGMRPSGQSLHTDRWNAMSKANGLQNNKRLGAAKDFVKQVLDNRSGA
jgi:hypothetical protein